MPPMPYMPTHFRHLPLARTAAWADGSELLQWHLRNRTRLVAATFPADAWGYR